jgi:hypothetical protein
MSHAPLRQTAGQRLGKRAPGRRATGRRGGGGGGGGGGT